MIGRKALLVEPRRFEIMDVNEEINSDQVLIKIASCGLCNWELNFWKGKLNYLGYPHPLGHEYAGTVVAVGKNVKDFQEGDKVSSISGFGGFADYVAADADKVIKLKSDIDTKYVLGEPQKCVITVLRAADAQPGDYGIVLGCGPMGQWCIQALGCKYLSGLIAIDIDDKKLAKAKKYGATAVINSAKEDVEAKVREYTGGHMADFVIEGTGLPMLLNQAQLYLRTSGRGKLVLMSAYEDVCREFDFRKAIDKSIEILVAHPGHSLDAMDDLRRAVNYINNGTFYVKEMISHEFGLTQINRAFDMLEHKPKDYLKGLVYPD
ncbi:MAG: zinc-dependent alcohol dehydrogenase [Marvinbryantia sp.]|jgi:threonine dehydrogenase-like Zn-dependent dehydrogenase